MIVNNLLKRATMQILDAESAETVALEHIQEYSRLLGTGTASGGLRGWETPGETGFVVIW
ncbi:MAG: hypothetical protein LBS48_00175 [Treponema sp.]|jgi:hypothetical protein|nr:hypothetical protein [Treponema sp.]